MVRWTKTTLGKRFKPRKPNLHLSAGGKGKSSSPPESATVCLYTRKTPPRGPMRGCILFNTQDQRVVQRSASLPPHPTIHIDTETAFRTFSLASWPFGGEVNTNPPSRCRRRLRSHAQSHTGSITPSHCPWPHSSHYFRLVALPMASQFCNSAGHASVASIGQAGTIELVLPVHCSQMLASPFEGQRCCLVRRH